LSSKSNQQTTPLVEGDQVTFIWRGPRPVSLLSDATGWEPDEAILLRSAGPNLWTHTLRLPPDAFVEYIFVSDGKALPDPANPHQVFDGIGSYHSYFYMPETEPTSLSKPRKGIKHGSLTRHTIESEYMIAGRSRSVYLYQPPTTQPCPLLVVFDGRDYLRRAHLVRIVESLTVDGRIRPLALAMISHGGQARIVEYACNDATIMLLLEQVLPLGREKLDLLDPAIHPGAYGVMGASMGGLISLYAGLRLPHIFGHVLSQSGAFWPESVIFHLAASAEQKPERIWMDVGRYEGLLEDNQRMADLLASHGYASSLRVYNGGHNYTAWGDDLWRGLEALFPPER
jgi:enterochelin esterase family protein